jgi:uncharacterized protein (DUF2237 family)
MPADEMNASETLALCSSSPRTGFYRDGCCNGPEDVGLHVVCTQVTADFLEFAREQGNDLITPMPEYGFPGLVPGDRWCVCAATWRQALEAGVASPVILAATHEETLAVIPLADLRRHALDHIRLNPHWMRALFAATASAHPRSCKSSTSPSRRRTRGK